MLLIGSSALKFNGVRWRKPRDLDRIATKEEYDAFVASGSTLKFRISVPSETKRVLFYEDKSIAEFEIALPGSSGESLMKIVEAEKLGTPGFTANTTVVHSGVVLALKLTHRYLKNNPHFVKTMNDIIELRELGYEVPWQLLNWMKEREKETYWYKHPSLERNKENFFAGDGINYIYEHDDIHDAVALSYQPAFKWFQTDNADVKVSKAKWKELGRFEDGREIQLNSVLEESYVLALERCLIPNNFTIPPRRAFTMALEKVCTSITSGWWREFAWENYHLAVGLYNKNYVDRFKASLADGKIRPYQGKAM
jgi:hypothetical protein